MNSRLRVVTPIEIHDPLPRSQTSGSFQTQKPLAEEVAKSIGGSILKYHGKKYSMLISPIFLKKTYGNSAEKIHTGERGISKYFEGIGSELTLIHRVPKHHIREEAYRGQVINNILVRVWLSVGPVGPWTQPVVTSPVPECRIEIDVGGCCSSLHLEFFSFKPNELS